jgi:hypothetical protein
MAAEEERGVIAEGTATILAGARDTTRRLVAELEELRRNLRRLQALGEAAKREGDDDVRRG